LNDLDPGLPDRLLGFSHRGGIWPRLPSKLAAARSNSSSLGLGNRPFATSHILVLDLFRHELGLLFQRFDLRRSLDFPSAAARSSACKISVSVSEGKVLASQDAGLSRHDRGNLGRRLYRPMRWARRSPNWGRAEPKGAPGLHQRVMLADQHLQFDPGNGRVETRQYVTLVGIVSVLNEDFPDDAALEMVDGLRWLCTRISPCARLPWIAGPNSSR